MYMMDDMIDIGLPDDKVWPTKAHRVVAQQVGLCNPRVTTRDALTRIVSSVLSIPNDKIEKVSLIDLVKVYGVPYINLS